MNKARFHFATNDSTSQAATYIWVCRPRVFHGVIPFSHLPRDVLQMSDARMWIKGETKRTTRTVLSSGSPWIRFK